MPRKPLEYRLKQNIIITEATGDCWIWNGVKSSEGVGIIRIKGKTKRVQRISYMYHLGEHDLPNHARIISICGNKLCINPDHLMLDETSLLHQGKTSHKRGTSHPNSKLTAEKVREIRAKYASHKYTLGKLSREYGVKVPTIRQIVTNTTWKGI